MLSHIWIKVGNKLLYEELQIKFDFRHGRRTFFLSNCPLSATLVFLIYLDMLSHIWMKVGSKLPYEELQIKFDFRYGRPTFFSELLPFVTLVNGSLFQFVWVGGVCIALAILSVCLLILY